MSQYTPPQFSSFGKSNLFQVYDRDSLDHSARLVTRNSCGGKTEFSVVNEPSSQPRGVVKTNFGLRGFLIDATLHTDVGKSSSIELKKKNVFAKSAPGINLSGSITTSEKDFSAKPKYGFFTTVRGDYTRNNFAATFATTTDEDSSVSLSGSAAVGFDGFSLGGDVKLVKNGDAALAAKSYNAGIAYSFKKYYTAALVSDAKFEKLKATVIAAQVNDSTFTVGAQAKIDLQAPKVGSPQREVILSIEQQATPSTTYKLAAVVTNGTIVGSVEHRLTNPSVSLLATAQTQPPNSAFAPFNIAKFGVAVAVGDY